MDTRTTNQWSDRQQRERAFYAEFAKRHSDEEVLFDPVLGDERRPWNPYWHLYHTVHDFHPGPGANLLDFGCGTGSASMLYARMGYQVTGFDICEENIEVCQRRAERYELADRTRFAVMTAEQLELADGQFDVVAGIDILHHVDIESSIREVWRVLRPGGLAVFREFVEVPWFDRLRRGRLVTHFFPSHASVDEHRTEDERKLTSQDLETIGYFFPNLQQVRFCLFSRIYRVLPRRHPERPCRLEQWDARLFQRFPWMQSGGGELVLKLRKAE